MREGGLEPMAVVSHAALLGTSDNIHPCADYAELVEGFDLDNAVQHNQTVVAQKMS
jgi:hypothetical protein